MQTFIVPWSFFMVFNYEQDQLIVHFSKDMKHKNQELIDPLVLQGDDIREVIHRYDYRKPGVKLCCGIITEFQSAGNQR